MTQRRRQHGEGSVYHRKSRDQWVAVADLGWRDGKRDRREFTGPTPEIAMGRRQAFLDRRRDGFTMPRGRQPFVSEWMLHWLHNIARRKVEASTWDRSYRQKVTDHVAPFFDRVPLADLDEELVDEWHLWLEGKGLSASTITQCHRILSAGIKQAVVRKRIVRNPLSNVTPPRITTRPAAPPEEAEGAAILAVCETRRTGPRWIAAMETGIRQGEALGLLWPYVSLDADPPAIDIQWALTRQPVRHGCDDPHACGRAHHRYPCPAPCPKAARASGRRHACVALGDRCCPPGCEGHARACPRRIGGLVLKAPKTRDSAAPVPLTPYAAAALRQWRLGQKAERLAHPAWRGWAHSCPRLARPGEHVCPACMLPFSPGLLVFANPDGSPVDAARDWDDWSGLLAEAGLPHYRVHDARHYTASTLLAEGIDVRVVQELMRHSTPDFTRRVYQHVRRQLRSDAADAIERAHRGRR